ncbi:MAG: HEAT repeat domain-containing protein [Candidatus Muiribacteriota bacterium]
MNARKKLEKIASGTWSEKFKIAATLLESDKKSETELVMALTSENEDIRYWALKILGEKAPQKYSFYAEAMIEDEIWFVRCQAVQNLLDADSTKYFELIKELFEKEKDENVREFIKERVEF